MVRFVFLFFLFCKTYFNVIIVIHLDDSKVTGGGRSENESGCSSGAANHKELPTRTKKDRRRHDRHHELLSTAARARQKEYKHTHIQ